MLLGSNLYFKKLLFMLFRFSRSQYVDTMLTIRTIAGFINCVLALHQEVS